LRDKAVVAFHVLGVLGWVNGEDVPW